MSAAQLTRAMHQYVAQQRRAVSAPVACWLGIGETVEQFAERIGIIASMHDGRILAAVPYGFPCPDGCEAVELPPKHFVHLHPQNPSRYRIMDGGRGSAKSHSYGIVIVLDAFMSKMRVLIVREIMKSLRESSQQLIVEIIERLNLQAFFTTTDREITSVNGSEIIFAGLFANIGSLKSLENISRCWIEEAESVSENSLEVLMPTIRAPNSEIWISLNFDSPDAPVMEYIDGTRDDVHHVHVDYRDNPWFPDVLLGELQFKQRTDDDTFRHVWLGECRKHSEAQIFRGKYNSEPFTPLPSWDGPYFGADWGYSRDPTTLVKVWIFNSVLFIEYEAYGIGVDIDRTPAMFDQVPGARAHTIRADSARPETISYMQRNGFPNMIAAEKGKGSVEDGITHIRSYEKILIHPRCTHALEEFRLYSFKVDKRSGNIMPEAVDSNNHIIDALRYGLEPIMKKSGADEFLKWQFAFNANGAATIAQSKTALPYQQQNVGVIPL